MNCVFNREVLIREVNDCYYVIKYFYPTSKFCFQFILSYYGESLNLDAK